MRSAAAQRPTIVIICNYTFVITVHQEQLRWIYIQYRERGLAGRQADRQTETDRERETEIERVRERELEIFNTQKKVALGSYGPI